MVAEFKIKLLEVGSWGTEVPGLGGHDGRVMSMYIDGSGWGGRREEGSGWGGGEGEVLIARRGFGVTRTLGLSLIGQGWRGCSRGWCRRGWCMY